MSLEEILRKLIFELKYYKRAYLQAKSENFSSSQLERLEHLIKESKKLEDINGPESSTMGV